MLVVTILSGIASIGYSLYRYSQTRYVFILFFVSCLMAVNLSLLTFLPDEYLVKNEGYLMLSDVKAKLVYLYAVVGFIIDFLWIFLLIQSLGKFGKIPIRKAFSWANILSLVAVIGYFSIMFFRVTNQSSVNVLHSVQQLIHSFILLFYMVALGYIYVRSAKASMLKIRTEIRLVIGFSGIFWLVVLLLSLGNFFWDLSLYQKYAELAAHMAINLVPFIFLSGWIAAYKNLLSDETKSSDQLAKLYAKYQISQREQEIIAIIREGKTNKQIADQLFISEATVKDHIHNIYSKVLVKNRVQLLNLFKQ